MRRRLHGATSVVFRTRYVENEGPVIGSSGRTRTYNPSVNSQIKRVPDLYDLEAFAFCQQRDRANFSLVVWPVWTVCLFLAPKVSPKVTATNNCGLCRSSERTVESSPIRTAHAM